MKGIEGNEFRQIYHLDLWTIVMKNVYKVRKIKGNSTCRWKLVDGGLIYFVIYVIYVFIVDVDIGALQE